MIQPMQKLPAIASSFVLDISAESERESTHGFRSE
jgi:hypothetical protein